MKGELSTLDYVLAAAGTRQRPADFGIVLHFAKGPTLEALRRGSRSARNRYPISNAVIRGRQWTPLAVPEDGVGTTASARAAAEATSRARNARRTAGRVPECARPRARPSAPQEQLRGPG